MSLELEWFEGEVKLCECEGVGWQSAPYSTTPNGVLILTNFRLRFVPDHSFSVHNNNDNYNNDNYNNQNNHNSNTINNNNNISDHPHKNNDNNKNDACDNRVVKKFDIVLYNIESIYRVKKKKRKALSAACLLKKKVAALEIVCKTFQMVSLSFEEVHDVDLNLKMVYSLVEATIDANIDPFLSHACQPDASAAPDDRSTQRYTEGLLGRGGEGHCRIVSVNEAFHVSESLPKSFVVPSSLTSRDVIDDAPKFVNNRFPFWVYTYPPTHTSLFRMACKVASVQEDVEDKIYKSIRASHPSREFPQIYNLNSLFPSYNDIFHSYLSLQALCVYDPSKDSLSDSKWLSQLEATAWLSLVSTCLTTAQKIATTMSVKKLSVIIKEWNSSVLSPLISCLVQLMLEHSIRERGAFEDMVAREWLFSSSRFAYKHQSRSFTPPCESRCEVDQYQFPIFLLFLDCVFQLLTLAPTHFSFNQVYLQVLWNTVCCGLYKDLLFNSPRELHYNHLHKHSFHLATLRKQRQEEQRVTGTMMRQSHLDFSTLRRTKQQPMHSSYYGGMSSKGALARSQAPSLASLNSPLPPVRKQSLISFFSPDSAFFPEDHKALKRMPHLQLFGELPTHAAASLWDWSFVLHQRQLNLFDNIQQLASLSSNPPSTFNEANNADGQSTTAISSKPLLRSALIINGLKVYNYSSFTQFDASQHNLFFSNLSFSLPFLFFWSDCYLKYHPSYHSSSTHNSFSNSEVFLPDQQTDPFHHLHHLRQQLLVLQECLRDDI